MKNQTVLIKRSIERDGLVYLKCPDCNGSGQKSQQEIDALMPCHECKAEGYISVPLSSLIESSMPTELKITDEINSYVFENDFGEKTTIYRMGMRKGIEWLKNKLTSKP